MQNPYESPRELVFSTDETPESKSGELKAAVAWTAGLFLLAAIMWPIQLPIHYGVLLILKSVTTFISLSAAWTFVTTPRRWGKALGALGVLVLVVAQMALLQIPTSSGP